MGMRSRSSLTIAVFVFLASLSAGAPGVAAADSDQHFAYHRPLTGAQSVMLKVTGDLGAEIQVMSTASSSIDVKALARGSLASGVELNAHQTAQGIQLSFDFKSGTLQRWFHAHDTQLKVTLRVPQATTLTVSAVDGSITVADVTGPLSVDLVNGPITVKGAGDVVSLNCVNGPIDVGITDVSKIPDVSLNVTNGEIDISVPRNFRATVTAHVVMGSVDDNLANTPGQGKLVANAVTGAITINQR